MYVGKYLTHKVNLFKIQACVARMYYIQRSEMAKTWYCHASYARLYISDHHIKSFLKKLAQDEIINQPELKRTSHCILQLPAPPKNSEICSHFCVIAQWLIQCNNDIDTILY